MNSSMIDELPIIITAAGMPRSASTWLYNAVRIIISEQPHISFNCGWVGDWEQMPRKKFMLLKAHGFIPELAKVSSVIFYSYRDVRDAVASQERKTGTKADLELAESYVDLHEKWMQVADFTMKYELFLHEKEGLIPGIVDILNAKNIISCDRNDESTTATSIVSKIAQVNYDAAGDKTELYHKTNLFHKDHVTDGRHGAWKESLNTELASTITDRFAWWFEKYGYTA